MNNSSQNTNSSIRCSVDTCRHYSQDHCTLDQIKVGTKGMRAKEAAGTECDSFHAGQCDSSH